MGRQKIMKKKRNKIGKTAMVAMVSGLYVAISLLLSALSFGIIQVRFAEMFNHMQSFNKKYIAAVVVGCAITNMFSPFGIVDVIWGSATTAFFLWLSYKIGKNIKSVKKRLVVNTLIFGFLGMIPVALELNVMVSAPLIPTYLICLLGELVSMTVGGVIIYLLSKRIDLTQ